MEATEVVDLLAWIKRLTPCDLNTLVLDLFRLLLKPLWKFKHLHTLPTESYIKQLLANRCLPGLKQVTELDLTAVLVQIFN